LLIRRAGKPCGARRDFAGQRFLRGVLQRLGVRAARRCIRHEHEAIEAADDVALDDDFTGLVDLRLELGVLAQPPHQHAGAAIDEALGEPLVQRIGQLVFDRARHLLPMFRIREPVGPVGCKSPGPNVRDAGRQGVDVAVGAIGQRDLMCKPVDFNRAVALQETVQRHH
jgi:hypothetical protein